MSTENDWRVVNAYKKIARRGQATPLACEFCGDPVITRAGEADEVLFQCFSCDTVYDPGALFLGILEHLVEINRFHSAAEEDFTSEGGNNG